MRKYDKTLWMVFALAYFFAASINTVSFNFVNSGLAGNTQPNPYEVIAADISSQFPIIENPTTSSSNISNIPVKIIIAEFSIIIENTEKLVFSKFVQYLSISTNYYIKLRKSNIIYPFHNFW